MPEKMVFHICRWIDWEIAQEKGEYRADSMQTEGFIHCSEKRQIKDTLQKCFPDERELILLHIEVRMLRSAMIYEEADGQMFPHIYGPINLEAIVKISKV